MPISPSRVAAFDILLRIERDQAYASELLHSTTYASLSNADHALATELVMGVLRWRSRLDEAIASASSKSLAKLDLEILIALCLAVYQFHWLDRIPKRAALHESVELVKRARKRSAAPFVNAVLRKLSGAAENLLTDVNVEYASAEVVARIFAHPQWIVERWASQHGLATAQAICQYDQSIPETAIRLRMRGAEDDLTKEKIPSTRGVFLASARRTRSGELANTETFRSGGLVIQDESSQLVAALVGDRNSNAKLTVLDCCAAPGGKTLAIADRNPGSQIVAVELHPHRARLLQKLLRARSSRQIQVLSADARKAPFSQPFDRILADVPCSGTGTLARNPEIKWRLTPDDLADLQSRQIEILRSATSLLKKGGRLIYSTCSLEREENEEVVERVVAENRSLRPLDCRHELDLLKSTGELIWPDVSSLTRGPYLRTIPGIHPCDGFFAAILEKT